jgi:hypothetical protein
MRDDTPKCKLDIGHEQKPGRDGYPKYEIMQETFCSQVPATIYHNDPTLSPRSLTGILLPEPLLQHGNSRNQDDESVSGLA